MLLRDGRRVHGGGLREGRSSRASTSTRSPGVRSIRRIKELAEEHGAEIFFSHDMDAWKTYKQAPDYYEL